MAMQCGKCSIKIDGLNWQGNQLCDNCSPAQVGASAYSNQTFLSADKLSFGHLYSDGSGFEYMVSLDANVEDAIVIFSHGDAAAFPIEQLDWLLACLQRIKNEIQV